MAATEGGIYSELFTDAIVLCSMDEFNWITHMRTLKRESFSIVCHESIIIPFIDFR